MPKRARWYIPAACWAALAGCGYVGDPLPPSLNIPSPIGDLRAFERGEKLVIDFTIPALTTDGVGLRRIGAVELRVGPESGNWAGEAARVEAKAAQPGAVHVETSARPWVGQQVRIGARVVGRTGRFSDWSNAVRLNVVPPLETPASVKVEGTAAGVRVSWAAVPGRPEVTWRVLRRAPEQKEPDLLGTAAKPEYVDGTAQYGKVHEYSVEAAMKAGDAEAESEPSRPVAIPYEDRFPPTVPAELTAVAGLGSIQLTWNPDAEADLKGYYIYRSAGDELFARVGELVESPSYTDRAVQAGRRYRYAVSAVDQSGNESARSAAVEVTAQ